MENIKYKIFNENDIDKNFFDDRWVKFAFGPQGLIKTDKFNFGIVEFSENKTSKTHKHNVEEALYILSGRGKVKIENNIYDIKEKDFIYIPENTNHTIITNKDSKLKILFIFSDKIVIEQ